MGVVGVLALAVNFSVAAVGVYGTGTVWPDVAVAAVLAVLGLSSGRIVIRHALAELRG